MDYAERMSVQRDLLACGDDGYDDHENGVEKNGHVAFDLRGVHQVQQTGEEEPAKQANGATGPVARAEKQCADALRMTTGVSQARGKTALACSNAVVSAKKGGCSEAEATARSGEHQAAAVASAQGFVSLDSAVAAADSAEVPGDAGPMSCPRIHEGC